VTPTERRRRITDVFELAVQLRPEERDAFVERECRGDSVLLKEVSSLLSEYRRFGNTPAPDQDSAGDQAASLPKQRIGRYQITGTLGSGGFGRVYRALDPTVGRVVAIKVLNAPDDSDIVRRFQAEATTVANLHHKNIVTVHEFGEEHGAPYLVMEFLDGTTLQELIERNSLSLLEKLEIMSAVAEGLQYAHERSVTHRDVKPANIMRLADGSVKIMDFGIARIATESSTRLTQTGFVIGSLLYMAPEQFQGTADALSDVFAYGVTFYELLTGHNPFSSPDPAVVMFRITNTDPPSVRTALPDCPEALDRIVRRSMARSREARYSSLSDVVVDTLPILLELRRDHAGRLYSEAENLFAADQLDAARSAARKVLELDPGHAGARRLRSRIDEALHRRDVTARASSLMETIEKELRGRQYQEASSLLSNLRLLGAADARLQARIERAEAQIQQAQRCDKLLETAREDLKSENLTEAFRAVSEVLSSDPSSNSGRHLLQEIQQQLSSRETARRLKEEIARVDGLLLIGETDQALAVVAEIEKRHPGHAQIPSLRARAEAQKAQEDRSRRLAEGVAEVKARLRNSEFDRAIGTIDALLGEFADNTELQMLRKHAAEHLAAKLRLNRIASLKSESASLIERQEFDAAAHALEAGVAELGDDGELTRLLQAAIAGKAARERKRAVSTIVEETEQLRRSGKLDEAIRAVERAVRIWGEEPALAELIRQLADEKSALDRKYAIRDVARKARVLVDQKKPQAALTALRQCIEKYGDDEEIQTLVDLARGQVREGERSVRLRACREEIKKLAGASRFEEALQRAEDAILAFPEEPSLAAERDSLLASRVQQRREQAIREILSKIDSLRSDGRFADASRLVQDGLREHGQDSRLLEAQQYLSEGLAAQQRAEDLDKACKQAQSLRDQNRFQEALRVLDACAIRYPNVPAIAHLVVEVKNDRDRFVRRREMDKALADAADLVQREQPDKALEVLEEALKAQPESRELADAATRIRSGREETERRRDIAECVESIERALTERNWNQAISRAATAEEQFPGEAVFPRLKRRAQDGKHKAELDEVEASFATATRQGNLGLAGEIVAAALIRWPNEKRLRKLQDEIELGRAEECVAQARKLVDDGHYDEAERLAREALTRRPKLSSATDLLEAIAARKRARSQEEQLRVKASVPPPDPARARRAFVWIAAAAAVVAAGGAVLWIVRPHTPSGQSRQIAPSALTVGAPAGSTTGVRGQDFSGVLRTSGGMPPIRWNIGEGSLPPGLGLDSNTGSIAGKPSAGGAFTFTAMASDSAGNQARRTITITVEEPAGAKKPGEAANSTDSKSQQERAPSKGVGITAGKPNPNAPVPGTTPLRPAAPTVSQFAAEPGSIQRGQSSMLRWEVSGSVTGVTINQGVGAVQNIESRRVQPNDSVTYTLTATGPGGTTTASATVSVSAPPPPAPPPCKASTFVLDQYGDLRAGQLTWTGTLPARGRLEIQNRRASSGNIRGDSLPKGVPVRISVVPDTVRATTVPSAANCWDPQLVLLNSGQAASEVRIRWEVFQP
jgi:serine/threonine-protein kinase